MKSMTKMMVVAMVLVAALVVAPAAARTYTGAAPDGNAIYSIAGGDAIYVGEENLDLSTLLGQNNGWLVHFSSVTDKAVDKQIPISNAADFELTKTAVGTTTGTYYVFNTSPFDPATTNTVTLKGTVIVDTPTVGLDVVLNKSLIDSVNGKTVTRENALAFKLTNNLAGFNTLAWADQPKMKVEVTLPGGGVTTQFGGQTLGPVAANGSTVYVYNASLDGVEAGTYTAQAKWYSDRPGASFYNKGYDSNAATFEVLTKSLAITANKDTVVRGNSFTVTITGESVQEYHLFVQNVSNAVTDHPLIAPGQSGIVTIHDQKNVTVKTNAAGTRSIQFNTSSLTDDRSFTIRVEALGAASSNTYDEVKVRVEKGAVTVTAAGTGVYYLGEEITLSGTNTDSDTIYLFMTGPNLATDGVNLENPGQSVVTVASGSGNFTTKPVETDDTWTYKWDTSRTVRARNLDAGGYTVYAVSQPRDKGDLSGAQYDTASIQLRSAFITATTSGATVAKGDDLTISGTAQGNPSTVRIWVFGKNYYGGADGTLDYRSATVESDGSFEEEIDNTDALASGQYFVVIQHPMGANFGVEPGPNAGEISGLGIPTAKLTGLPASEAANALINALDSPNVPDTYVKLTFVVEEPNIFIDPIGDKASGSKFTISGTTNLAVGDKLNVEVTSAAFQPTTKTEATGFSNVAGTATVQKGDGANKWSMDVDATGFKPDQYIVRVESVETDTTQTATFNVIEGQATTQPTGNVTTAPTGAATTAPTTAPTTATPTQSPGFGALVALAGLGAVAFLVLRRK